MITAAALENSKYCGVLICCMPEGTGAFGGTCTACGLGAAAGAVLGGAPWAFASWSCADGALRLAPVFERFSACAWMAAPSATTSSGSMSARGFLPKSSST